VKSTSSLRWEEFVEHERRGETWVTPELSSCLPYHKALLNSCPSYQPGTTACKSAHSIITWAMPQATIPGMSCVVPLQTAVHPNCENPGLLYLPPSPAVCRVGKIPRSNDGWTEMPVFAWHKKFKIDLI